MGRTKAVPIKNFGANKLLQNERVRKPKRVVSYIVLPPDDSNERYSLGEICLGLTSNILPEIWSKCKVSFIASRNLQMEFDSNTTVLVNITNDFKFVKGLFTSKIFAMKFCNRADSLYAELYVSQLPLPRFNKMIGNVIQMVFATIFDIKIGNSEALNTVEKIAEAKEIAELYKNVKIIRDRNSVIPKVCVQHSCLKPKLRPYQEDAVRWMLFREQEPVTAEMLHPLYQTVSLTTGTTIYFDKHTGFINNVRPVVSTLRTGGILADEMGLGKTVEVLACILCHPKPNELNTSEVTETESNASSSNLEIIPMIQKQSRKRKRESNTNNQKEGNVDTPKKLKVPDDWVKSSSKKSDNRVALELWYENMLQEVSVKETTTRSPTNRVQCICGDTDMKGCIKCIDCSKYQHGTCLGYKKTFGEYRCPQCWMNCPLLESKATLIVSPVSLRSQWCEEICKHVGASLKVLVYEGSRATCIYPTELRNYDLVLTTYNILQAELRLSETGQVIRLRTEPRYSVPGSPLTLIKWWRLCLDEAQTVEVPSSMISTMAKKLNAHHRWAITGTPICRDISGLYGLIDYLQLEPYSEAEAWHNLLYLPYLSGNMQPMLEFLAQVMWRSSKSDVIEQINIPNQTIKEYVMDFSAVEKFYYKREHELCASHFIYKLLSYNGNVLIRSLEKSKLKKLMAPLLSIRQACTHPSATKGRYLASRKPVTSMEGLLDALIEKNVNDSEEHLRLVVSALNGLAGIYLLLKNPIQAVAEYRKVLQLAARFNSEDTKKGLTVDKLQLIHAVHNLADVLDTRPLVQPTLRDHTLRQDCLVLQEKYMERYINQNLLAYKETQTATNIVSTLQEKCILTPGQWYSCLIDWITINNLLDDLVSRIQNVLDNANYRMINVSNERKLLYMVGCWDQEVTSVRTTTISLLNQMYSYCEGDDHKFVIAEGLVQAAMDCHLRPVKKSKNTKKCFVCKISVQMRKYEAVLFDMTKNSEDISNKGSWKPTSQELVLKALLGIGRARNANIDFIKDGEVYFNILEAMKKEFKQMRKFWTHLDQQICAHDEITMCKTRLSLKESQEEEHKRPSKATNILKQLSNVLENRLESINLIGVHELDYQASVLQNEERQNMATLERNLGTYSYLETLRCQQYEGRTPDPCPICKNALQDHWSVLPCGHSYCLECIQLLLEKTTGNRVSCSVCRQLQKVKNVSYIRTTEEAYEPESIKIKGNYSTKVEAIVKLVLTLRAEDSNVKILVFSTWPIVLNILQIALTKNDIATELMLSHNLQQTLNKFKNKSVTALLLPIQLGSKGLNLIEATHVILVEPLLNPADELQAIGRVHRIGQTRPTTVHKFIVRNTIEESLHHATSSNADVWDKNKITLQQLKNLFFETMKDTEPTNNFGFMPHTQEIHIEDIADDSDFALDESLSLEDATDSVENEHNVPNESDLPVEETEATERERSFGENQETHVREATVDAVENERLHGHDLNNQSNLPIRENYVSEGERVLSEVTMENHVKEAVPVENQILEGGNGQSSRGEHGTVGEKAASINNERLPSGEINVEEETLPVKNKTLVSTGDHSNSPGGNGTVSFENEELRSIKNTVSVEDEMLISEGNSHKEECQTVADEILISRNIQSNLPVEEEKFCNRQNLDQSDCPVENENLQD